MKSIKEVEEFIKNNIDDGPQTLKVELSDSHYYGQRIDIRFPDWESKIKLINSPETHWLVKQGAQALDRKYLVEEKRIATVGHDRMTSYIKEGISDVLAQAIEKTIPAAAPKRTKIYKQLMDMYHTNKREDSFLNEVLPIVEYYRNSSKEDKDSRAVHYKNIHTLLTILGRKYGNGNSSSR